MRITFNPYPDPADGKLAEAVLHFEGDDDHPLAGLKLVGFVIWQGRRSENLFVTFPSRQYVVNGERRSFALLRADGDMDGHNRLRDAILAAWHAENARLDGDEAATAEMGRCEARPTGRQCSLRKGHEGHHFAGPSGQHYLT